MTAVPTRKAFQGRRLIARRGRDVAVASLIVLASFALSHGFSAAAGDEPGAKSEDGTPIVLAGRWTGPRYGFGVRKIRPVKTEADEASSDDCGGKACTLTYDIVACGDGWCGIAVSDAAPCGAIGLRMTADASHNRRNAFAGKLELAKGSAPYTIEAWYAPADDGENGAGRDAPRLSFVGDTGGELLMMRRSFPFQAELTRISDAQCTLEKATS